MVVDISSVQHINAIAFHFGGRKRLQTPYSVWSRRIFGHVTSELGSSEDPTITVDFRLFSVAHGLQMGSSMSCPENS